MTLKTVGLRECNHCCYCPKCAPYASDQANLEAKDPVYRTFVERYGQPIGEGGTRIVFDRGDGWVVKFPKYDWGERVNRGEAYRYEKEKDTGRLAQCYLEEFQVGKYKVIPIVHMEAVAKIADWPSQAGPVPDWVHRIDSCQVGLTRDGRLVAYDYP